MKISIYYKMFISAVSAIFVVFLFCQKKAEFDLEATQNWIATNFFLAFFFRMC
jgi:hypothetical protein